MLPTTHVLNILSDIDEAPAFEWIAEASRQWENVRLSFVSIAERPGRTLASLARAGHDVYEIRCRGKRDWPAVLLSLIGLMRTSKPDVVHAHLFQANILGLTAATLSRVPRRYYTRHHSTLHHVYHPKGVWWDRYVNLLADTIVAPSPAVADVLEHLEGVPRNRIAVIPHGFPLERFRSVSVDRRTAFRLRHGIPLNARLVGVSSRFVLWKGVEYTIRAYGRLRRSIPDLHLVLLNATGNHRDAILVELSGLPPNSWTCVKFDSDVPAAYANMSCFVHVPISADIEAFGQVYVEALAAGVPSVFTISGIASAMVTDESNALVVPYRDTEKIYEAIHRILNDAVLADTLRLNGQSSVQEVFSIERMTGCLHALYATSSVSLTAQHPLFLAKYDPAPADDG